VLTGASASLADVPRKKPAKNRPKWDVGRKVARWLADNATAGKGPKTKAALHRATGISEMQIGNYIRLGSRPGQHNLRALAQVMCVDMEWLGNDARGWEERDVIGEADAIWRRWSPEFRQRLARVGSSEAGFRALQAALAALGAAGDQAPAKPR
jgi:hypothetical protein